MTGSRLTLACGFKFWAGTGFSNGPQATEEINGKNPHRGERPPAKCCARRGVRTRGFFSDRHKHLAIVSRASAGVPFAGRTVDDRNQIMTAHDTTEIAAFARLYRAHVGDGDGAESNPFRSKGSYLGWNGKPGDSGNPSNPSNPSKGVERKGSKIDPPLPRARGRIESANLGTRRWSA